MNFDVFTLSINGVLQHVDFELLPTFNAYLKRVGEGNELISYQGVSKAMKSKKSPGLSFLFQGTDMVIFQKIRLTSRKPFNFSKNGSTDL